MRFLTKTLLTTAALVLIAAPASARPPRGGP